jgi:hypothetical protein
VLALRQRHRWLTPLSRVGVAAQLSRHFAVEGQGEHGDAGARAALEEEQGVVYVEGEQDEEDGDKEHEGHVLLT